jgi:glutaredoxin 3
LAERERPAESSRISMMPKVVVYSKAWCPYSRHALALLVRKGVDFTEIDLDKEPQRRAEMVELSGGRRTVPQVFVGSTHVGGCDDLMALDARGGLDPLLAGDKV